MADTIVTVDRLQVRRSSTPGYRPGQNGTRPLADGEEFVNFADGVRLSQDGGITVEYPLRPGIGDVPGLPDALDAAAQVAGGAVEQAQAAVGQVAALAANAIQYSVRNGGAAAIQAAINAAPSGASVLVRLGGAINLQQDIDANGRVVSIEQEPGTTFAGTGKLPIVGTPSFFNVATKNIRRLEQDGTPAAPISNRTEPLAAYFKYTDIDNTVHPGLNATVVFSNYKYNRGQNANAIAVFAESVDPTGWGGSGAISFVEGLRGNGVLVPGASGGSAYGSITNAINQGVADYKCLFGIESGVLLYGGGIPDQPGWWSFNPGVRVAACYNAATAGDARADALFLANPFNQNNAHAAAAGVAITNNSVWDVAFASNAVCHKGLDLSLGTYDQGAILIPNNSDVRARKADGSGYQSLMYLEPLANKPVIGGGAPEIILSAPIYVAGGAVLAGTLGFGADNSYDIGSGGFRVRNAYLANNPTVTSDERLKDVRGGLTEKEIKVAKSIPVKMFRYKDAVAEKGDAARMHVGVIAQEVISAFEAEGLDAFAYGVVGSDPEIKPVEKTRVVSKAVTEDSEEEHVDYIERDGQLILTKKKRSVRRAVKKTLPIVDEAGKPLEGPVGEVDADGLPVYETDQVTDPATGETKTVRRQRKTMAPMFRDVPVMEDVEETYSEDEPTGRSILNVRYEQLAMFMIAAIRAQ